GTEFLVDPGTYTYHPEGPWRAYFRGTAAHNTVRIDNQDQSEPGGPFMWLRKANAACSFWHSSALTDVFEGWHDGYLRLADPVLHRRRIKLDKQTRHIFIDDTLEMAGEHDVELRFHCAPQCRAYPTADGDGYELRHLSKSVVLRLPRANVVCVNVRRGDDESPAGWISRRYGVKEPCDTIVWRARVTGRTLLRSELKLLI
ncbi:MAG TPA: heparinase II/III-family protein, partial [Gammaproteobacteria bacterium]|nr:heparinase II/III-family protein [Gammaproteobacteria bacterium]